MTLLSYADARKRAKEIEQTTRERIMPPWLPEPGYGEFQDERRLTSAEIDYRYREPLFLPRGSEVWMKFSYDNSEANPRNPSHPPREVRYGQQSVDEMGEFWMQVLARTPMDRVTLESDFRRKQLAEIIAYYTDRLRRDSADAKAHNWIGFAKSSLGKTEEAVNHLRRAISLDPRYDEPHLHLGLIWLDQGKLAESRAEFEAAVSIRPENGLAHGNLGLVLMNQGQLDAAEEHLRTAMRLNPKDTVARDNLQSVLKAKSGDRK